MAAERPVDDPDRSLFVEPRFPLYLDWSCGCRETFGPVRFDPGDEAVYRSTRVCPRDCADCASHGHSCPGREAIVEYPNESLEYLVEGRTRRPVKLKNTGSAEWEANDRTA